MSTVLLLVSGALLLLCEALELFVTVGLGVVPVAKQEAIIDNHCMPMPSPVKIKTF